MASQILDLLQPGAPNLSLLAILGALGLAAAPHWYTIYLAETNRVNGGWSNVNPRAYVLQLATKVSAGGKLTPLEAKILRGQSAQANGFENAPLFGLVMLIGTYAKLPSHTLNRTAAFYLVGRAIFNYLYLTTTSKKNSYLRTIVFNAGVIALLRIIVLSTLQINN
ncbi:hypothetical protein CF319_g4314 [Tilletia indica]|nr:hypothetical protein CF319_g4314 [Tilletia indica]KAE8231719.1 hypothetical protein CF326_g3260 [Tilletia indica]